MSKYDPGFRQRPLKPPSATEHSDGLPSHNRYSWTDSDRARDQRFIQTKSIEEILEKYAPLPTNASKRELRRYWSRKDSAERRGLSLSRSGCSLAYTSAKSGTGPMSSMPCRSNSDGHDHTAGGNSTVLSTAQVFTPREGGTSFSNTCRFTLGGSSDSEEVVEEFDLDRINLDDCEPLDLMGDYKTLVLRSPVERSRSADDSSSVRRERGTCNSVSAHRLAANSMNNVTPADKSDGTLLHSASSPQIFKPSSSGNLQTSKYNNAHESLHSSSPSSHYGYHYTSLLTSATSHHHRRLSCSAAFDGAEAHSESNSFHPHQTNKMQPLNQTSPRAYQQICFDTDDFGPGSESSTDYAQSSLHDSRNHKDWTSYGFAEKKTSYETETSQSLSSCNVLLSRSLSHNDNDPSSLGSSGSFNHQLSDRLDASNNYSNSTLIFLRSAMSRLSNSREITSDIRPLSLTLPRPNDVTFTTESSTDSDFVSPPVCKNELYMYLDDAGSFRDPPSPSTDGFTTLPLPRGCSSRKSSSGDSAIDVHLPGERGERDQSRLLAMSSESQSGDSEVAFAFRNSRLSDAGINVDLDLTDEDKVKATERPISPRLPLHKAQTPSFTRLQVAPLEPPSVVVSDHSHKEEAEIPCHDFIPVNHGDDTAMDSLLGVGERPLLERKSSSSSTLSDRSDSVRSFMSDSSYSIDDDDDFDPSDSPPSTSIRGKPSLSVSHAQYNSSLYML